MAASWDVFGDGKTALKVNFAKYVLGQALWRATAHRPQPFNVVLTGTRTWSRQQRQLHPGLRPHQPGCAGSDGGRRLRQVDTCGVVAGAGALLYNNSATGCAGTKDVRSAAFSPDSAGIVTAS